MKGEAEKHLTRAGELLTASRTMLSGNLYSDSISRSYYAAFHAATAVLEELGIERKSHQAVWAAFGKQVTQAGLLDKKYHSTGVKLFQQRIQSDYLPDPDDTAKDAEKALTFAAEFVSACRAFLDSHDKGA